VRHTYPLIVEQGDKGLLGFFPDLPGLMVGGNTREEVLALAREFIRDYLADFDRRGEPWPESTQAVALELVEVDESDMKSHVSTAAAG
jgi:predicted RNase H-like HicB family nuclease